MNNYSALAGSYIDLFEVKCRPTSLKIDSPRILMPVTDQVATAHCTDPIHNDFRLLRQAFLI